MNPLRLLLFSSFVLVSCALPALAQTAAVPEIQLVESIPVETTLDNPDIPDAAEVWHAMITEAKSTIEIEEFYISNVPGEPLERILQDILDAGARGVRVRLLADSRMAKTYPESIARLGKGTNIETRIIDFGKVAGGVQHAKYFIVDGAEIYLGSQNFDWRSLKHIHELGLRIRSAGVAAVYRDVFELDWRLALDPAARPTRAPFPASFTLAASGGDSARVTPTASPLRLLADSSMWDESHIVALMDEARTEVLCQFLAFSPVGRDKSFYGTLEAAMKRAALRGVKVRLIVSDWGKDRPTVDYLKSLSCFPGIEVKFSEIPEWSGGYVSFARVEHCKFVIADDRAFWLGTSNAEKSYFTTTRNVGAVVQSAGLTAQIRTVFFKSWNGPYTSLIRPEATYTPREHGER
jgi:phosphatidylserine/phosphatidylglycerophosphate/cardiolipin synthase-like enzyme